MGLKELVAAGIIAFSPVVANARIDRFVQDGQDLDKLVQESIELWKSNKPGRIGVQSDHEKAVSIYEKVVKLSPTAEHKETLAKLRRETGIEDFNTAQILLNYGMLNVESKKGLKDAYGVENADQAKELRNQLYRTVINVLEPFLDSSDEKAIIALGTAHSRFSEWDDAIKAYIAFINLKPNEPSGYKSLFSAYAGKKKVGDLLDSFEKIKGEHDKIGFLVQGLNAFYEDARKLNQKVRVEVLAKEDNQKAAKLFYLTSKARWDKEMKKENYLDRDFLYPIHECMRAGSFDLLAVETDEEREAAFNRFEGAYSLINKGMNDDLGRLDKYYAFVILKNKSIHIVDSDKVAGMLKQRYEK